MRYSRLILLSTLSAFALLTASTTSGAFAPSVTDMGLLKPQKMWQVGSVDAKNSSYCAMTGQFDKEISLAFARNAAGSGSLAIEFPGNILETGTAYQITMQVDDMESRRFGVRALSPRALVVQIGQDEDFYNSLGSNGILHIAMPTIDMHFDLKKFSGSYISLVTCAGKLPKHEGPHTAAMPVTAVEEAALASKAATPVVVAAPVQITPVSAGAPVTAQKISPAMQAEVNAVRQALNHKGINTQAAPAVPVAQAKPVAAPAVAAAPSNSGIIWATPAVATAAPVATTTPAAAAKKLPEILPHNITATVPKYKDEHENAVAENIELKSKLSQLEMERTELTNNVNLLKSDKTELQTKLENKEKQTQVLEAEVNAKDRDLDSVRSVSNNDSKSLSETQTQYTNLKRDHDTVVSELQAKLADKSRQYDLLQKQFTESAEARRTAVEASTQAQNEIETLRLRLNQTQQQIAAADLQKNDLTLQVDQQSQQTKSLVQRVQEQLVKAREQISMLGSQLTSVAMQKDDLASQLEAQVNKNKVLQANLEAKQREIAERAAQITPSSGTSSHDSMNLLGYSTPQDDMSAAPVVKASASGVKGHSDNWDTIVVQ